MVVPSGPNIVLCNCEIGGPDRVLVQTGLCGRQPSLENAAIFIVCIIYFDRPLPIERKTYNTKKTTQKESINQQMNEQLYEFCFE